MNVQTIHKILQQEKQVSTSMSTVWAFDHIENKHTLYRGKDYIKMFCESLREHAKNIVDFEKKKMLPLT